MSTTNLFGIPKLDKIPQVQGGWIKNDVYTFTLPAAFGTTSNHITSVIRNMNALTVKGVFNTGTAAASPALISLPYTLLTMDQDLLGRTAQIVGKWFAYSTSSAVTMYSSGGGGVLYFDGSNVNNINFANATGSTALQPINGNAFLASNTIVEYDFTVPIYQWRF